MPQGFDHVLLTRFSVRFTEDQPPAEEGWLAYRWGFFPDALASSLRNQTNRDFRWLVFFDAASPDWLREEVAESCPDLFDPVWLSDPWSLPVVQASVAAVADQPYLITTRLDSDDAVATKFVADLQSHCDHQESLYVNFLNGVQVERNGAIYRFDYPLNPFISYIERRSPDTAPRTVFQDFRHGYCQNLAPVLNVVGPPRWMQVVHGSNLANDIYGLRARPASVRGEFNLDLPYRDEVPGTTLAAETAVSAARMLRTWSREPFRIRQFATGKWLRMRGTRVLPQRTSP